MPGNSNLYDSSRNKQDEFYTNLQLVEDELKHYREHFKGKRVLCNCDDPYESNFFKYFAMSFNSLGLKSLTATCYAASPFAQMELDLFGDGLNAEAKRREERRRKKQPYKIVINEVTDVNGDGRIDLADVEWLIKNKKNVLSKLKGDGDFRSPECVALLDEADIVVTNPPFSLFREYMALLMGHNKQFLIVGNMNAVTYREIFPLIRDDKDVGDITNQRGIYEYLLSGDERHLSIRRFSDKMARTAYERQGGNCVKCGKHFAIEEMQADHITPWAKGGKTVAENCQMLCADCNRRKSDA